MGSLEKLLFVFVVTSFITVHGVEGGTEPWKKSEKSAERGAEVQLPCILISAQCGGLHSIKWYHGNTRIFIFSENVGLTRESNDIATRATMDYNVNATKTYLRIPDVKLEDEGLYKCEATYLSVNRECNNVQHITLNVNVRPDYIRVIEKDENINLTSGEILGPINEGKLISLRCESGEGKPVPTVEWYRDGLLKANSSTEVGENNIGTGASELRITVGRNELDSTFTCRVSSPALDEPLTLDVKLDVHVSPEKMDVKGVVGHVVSGTKILLECIVSAARPPANVTWYNGTELLNGENQRLEMFGTSIRNNSRGTFDTDSHLAFTASEYDNGRMFSCHAENSVTVAEGIKPMKEVTIIEVLYPPIVELRQENITVNETGEFDLFCDYVANPSKLKSVKWLLDDEIINVANNDHYDGGVPSYAPLTVRNASSSDMGRYTCVLENSVGESTVQDFIDVSVLYKPQVKVTMEPEIPVNEADRLNVSLTCEVVDGNPMTLSTVRWFLDGDLLKELPDCSRNSSNSGSDPLGTNGILVDETSTFCDIDPSKLLLEAVGRSFNGNYACEGRNDAGWGNRSASAPVVVHYKPGPAFITYEPKRVVKKGSLNITCSVLDLGRPEVTGFKWFRGSHQISGEEGPVLHIESVNLETKANFTCMAFNEAGDGDAATVFIDVAAKPDFIKPLNGYAGFAYNSTNVSIECWVECSPICNISWTRDGLPMDFQNTQLYYQTNVYHPPDQSKNDFESIQSTLVWNMTAWPDGRLHPFRDNENFTCESTGNGIGPGVKSETVFRVEFPPENMTISKKVIDVIVDYIPESVKCSAVAEPEPMFRWYREGSSDVISTDAVHVFKTKVPRRSNGTYICQAHNRHGQKNITTYLNVLFKPECRIDEEQIDGAYYLVCSAIANPKESDFTWSLKSDNDTLDQVGEIRDGKGYLRLDTSVTNFRTYVCSANNSIGFSLPCERGVPGNLPWWLQLEGDFLIIVIIVAMVILLAIVICCIVIWLVCRRKRAQAKYSNRVVEMEEREHPDGGPPSPTESSRSRDDGSPTSSHPTAAPRWPLKPGVLVHINRTHSLRSGLVGSLRANDTPRIHSGSIGFANDRYRSRPAPSIVRQPVRPFRRASSTNHRSIVDDKENSNQRALSAVSIMHDEGMIARANRIRAIFGSQLKEPDVFPGISRDKTSVTYKRIAPSHQRRILQLGSAPPLPERPINLHQIVSRKRKKPGADPSQATNNNHVDSVSESLPEPETKTFYENLPFHGIQTPPNKLVTSPKFVRVSALHGNSNSISVINSTSNIDSGNSNSGTVNAQSTTSTASTLGTVGSATSSTAKGRTSDSTNPATASPCSSQPASLSRATSLCGGSSGYESAPNRTSHLGPHYSSHNMPRSNSPEPKYNTLKPLRRRKHKQTHSRFYSLRLCRKHSEAAAAAAAAPSVISTRSTNSPSSSRRSYKLYAIPIVKSCPHNGPTTAVNDNRLTSSNSTIATTLRSTPDLTPTSSLGRSKSSSPLPTPPPTPPESPATWRLRKSCTGDTKNTGTKIPPIPAPRSKKSDPSRHTYQNVPPPVFPTRNNKSQITASSTPPLPSSSSTSSSTNTNITKHKSNNLYNYQEYYQQHQKQQQHYQIQQQEMQQYGHYNTGGTVLPSGSLSQLTLPLTRSLYHSSVVSPLETSFMPVHAQNHTISGRQPQQQQQQHHHHLHHHQFGTAPSQYHLQNRSEDGRGYIVGGDNHSSSNSPPLSMIHGTSDLELSSYALDHQLQLQQSSRRSASNQQLQHGGRRNERRKYPRKQHSDRNNDRKSKHRSRANAENRLRGGGGGGGGLVSDTNDLLSSITNIGIPIISDVPSLSQSAVTVTTTTASTTASSTTTPTTATSTTSLSVTTTTSKTTSKANEINSSATLKYNQYRQELGIPESYKISYPHYYEDAITPCPSDYHDTDASSAVIANDTSLGSNSSVSQQGWDRRGNQYVTSTGSTALPSTPTATLTKNPPPASTGNIHYSDLVGSAKIVATKSKRSSSGYLRSEQTIVGLLGKTSNQSAPTMVCSTTTGGLTTSNTTTTTTTSVGLLDETPSATTATVAANAHNTNNTSSSSSATTLPANSSNPPSALYAELHFRDVGREIDV